ncbi:SpoIID/LytB domain-containing protein [Paenibacillus sp. GCM10012307]|uniref:SpoIID/LytB domain-containing protein n=1 Tax=Paenibacillus roseus TaxID=2798579 RepID=A0A934MRJ4_9BACL|nr:SpoIID/LytB domain-containing protein [Paenibacillus roseus]MBJ6362948.1 SpoIID/LytB domain-containing protein [Paenibacillus roseus]
MRKFTSVLAATVAIAVMLSIWPAGERSAAAAENVRVGIYLNLPGKYTTTMPAVTLSGTQPLSVGMRNPSGAEAWTTVEPGRLARFTLDDYKVKLGETADFQTALSWLNVLQQSTNAALLTSTSKSGKTIYQVTEGSYATEAQAKAGAAKWGGNAVLTKLLGQNKISIMGPYHLEAGPYASLAEARKVLADAGSAGVDAYIALKKPQGVSPLQYYIHVGAETSQAGLGPIRAKAEAVFGKLAVAGTDAYLQLRDDYTVSKKAGTAASLFLVPGGDAKAWVTTAEDSTIKLSERSERTYRGSFELSSFNDKLAVINDLPIDHYLYAVVGGEMPASWHPEALKAQAVAARSYVRYQGIGFQIANVVDSTLSQVYEGTSRETASTIQAVDATVGEVLTYQGKVIEALFSSNAGGMTADGKEIWGNDVAYLKSVKSPDDVSEKGLYYWYRVTLPNGKVGYVREDLLEDTGKKTAAGSAIMRIKENGTNIRPIPLIQTNVNPVAKADSGTNVIALEKVVQSNENNWVRGPFTSDQLLESLKARVQTPISGSIQSLKVTATGPSGRVTAISINGKTVDIRYPDMLRSALGGLPSTRFEVDETARVTVHGRGDAKKERSGTEQLYVVGADGQTKALNSENFFVMNGSGTIRTATKATSYRFTGTGFGHGLGLSQYGAKGLAEQGYDYQSILKYYYKDITIVKE